MTELKYTFTPDWASPPGNTIIDLLQERNWTQSQLSDRLGYTEKQVSQMIDGKVSIDERTALKLEQVLGGTAEFWLKRESLYRTQLAKRQQQPIDELVVSFTDNDFEKAVNHVLDKNKELYERLS